MELSIIQIKDVLLSADIFTSYFCCDLNKCKGECCIEGDAGAPVTLEEISELENNFQSYAPYMTHAACRVVEKQGVSYIDQEADLVTSIVKGKHCVFTYTDKTGCCLCATERAFREGKTISFCKPISCFLYPIREKKLSNGLIALNYHRWDICKHAIKKGTELKLPLWKFLKEPLIKRFGEDFYKELEEVAQALSTKNNF